MDKNILGCLITFSKNEKERSSYERKISKENLSKNTVSEDEELKESNNAQITV